MQGLPKRVHDEGESSKEGNEGEDAGVEELLSRQHIGQLQSSAQPQLGSSRGTVTWSPNASSATLKRLSEQLCQDLGY